MKIKSWKAKLLAVSFVAVLLAMAAAPVITDSGDDEYADADLPSNRQLMTYAGYALPWLNLINIYATWYGGETAPEDPPAGDPTAVQQAFRYGEALRVQSTLNTVTKFVGSVLPADRDLIPFTTNYWERSAEYATSTYWTSNGNYDPIIVLNKTGLADNYSNYLYSWSMAIENGYGGAPELSTKWTADYAGMNLSLNWTGGSISGGTPANQSTKIWTDVLQIATPTSGHNVVYIDTSDPLNPIIGEEFGRYFTLYSFGGSGTLTNLTNGHTYAVVQGANDLKAGIHDNSTNLDGELPSGTSTSASVKGGMVFGQGSLMYYALPSGQQAVTIYTSTGTVSATSPTLTYTVAYNGPGGDATLISDLIGDVDGQEYNIIRMYDELVQSITVVSNRTVAAGEVLWDIFDYCESSNQYLSPSSITTNIPNHTTSNAEAEGVYIQALSQIAKFYTDGKTLLDSLQIVTNVESLDLHIYTDIYLNGALLLENVIITPYITNDDQHLTIGHNDWAGNGFAMGWAQVDNYNTWDGSTSLTNYGLIDLSSANALDIKKIVKNGASVTSIDLTRYTIKKYGLGGEDQADPPVVPKIYDAADLMTIILEEAALICVLLWWKYPAVWPFLVAAVVLALLGALAPNWILGFL